MKTIIALVLFAFSSLSFAATLTIDNPSTQTWVLIQNPDIYPACDPHPGFPNTCALPPQKKTEYTLPDRYNLQTFQLVSNQDSTLYSSHSAGDSEVVKGETNNLAYPLHGSANYSYSNETPKKQLLGCNTINRDAVSVQIVIGDAIDITCKTKEDNFIRWVDGSSDANMTITIRDL